MPNMTLFSFRSIHRLLLFDLIDVGTAHRFGLFTVDNASLSIMDGKILKLVMF